MLNSTALRPRPLAPWSGRATGLLSGGGGSRTSRQQHGSEMEASPEWRMDRAQGAGKGVGEKTLYCLFKERWDLSG